MAILDSITLSQYSVAHGEQSWIHTYLLSQYYPPLSPPCFIASPLGIVSVGTGKYQKIVLS